MVGLLGTSEMTGETIRTIRHIALRVTLVAVRAIIGTVSRTRHQIVHNYRWVLQNVVSLWTASNCGIVSAM